MSPLVKEIDMNFTMTTRKPYLMETFATLDEALAAGFKSGMEFDVHLPAGNVTWVWEMRP